MNGITMQNDAISPNTTPPSTRIHHARRPRRRRYTVHAAVAIHPTISTTAATMPPVFSCA